MCVCERDALEIMMSVTFGMFVPQVDTMIVQAIGLLDELDKEINTYAMRVREWYGWHFPEMAKVGLNFICICDDMLHCMRGEFKANSSAIH